MTAPILEGNMPQLVLMKLSSRLAQAFLMAVLSSGLL